MEDFRKREKVITKYIYLYVEIYPFCPKKEILILGEIIKIFRREVKHRRRLD